MFVDTPTYTLYSHEALMENAYYLAYKLVGTALRGKAGALYFSIVGTRRGANRTRGRELVKMYDELATKIDPGNLMFGYKDQ